MMKINGDDLLKVLGSGVRPAGVEGPKANATGAIDFAKLLAQAKGGEVKSGLPVALDPKLGVELDASGHERLSAAVDRLEAAGASRGVVMIDGHALVVDVADRKVTGLVNDESEVAGVQGVVRAAPAGDADAAGGVVSADPLWRIDNRGLSDLLAG
jgi:hypothetical protein